MAQRMRAPVRLPRALRVPSMEIVSGVIALIAIPPARSRSGLLPTRLFRKARRAIRYRAFAAAAWADRQSFRTAGPPPHEGSKRHCDDRRWVGYASAG